MKHSTGWQKLKAENKALKNQIIILVTEPDSIEAAKIKLNWSLIVDIEKTIWFGSPTRLPGVKDEEVIKVSPQMIKHTLL